MLNLEWIEYKNLQSIGNHPIHIDFSRSSTTLIGGNNGSGKSTLLIALAYNLFGVVLTGNKLAGIINSTNKKNLWTKTQFKKNGSTWNVVRGEKPKKFEIWKDDEKQDQYANARDQQKFLEVILGMDYKLFTQVVLLNKERYVPFMESPVADRRKIIEDILDISIFSFMNIECKNIIKSCDKELSTLENDRKLINTKIENKQEMLLQTQNQIESQKASVDDELKEIKDDILKKESERDSLNDQLESLVFSDLGKVQKKKKEIEHLSIDFDTKIKGHKKTISFFEDNYVCPTCDQNIADEIKENKIDLFQEKIDEIVSTTKEMMPILEKVVNQEKTLLDKKQKWNDLSRDIREIDSNIKMLNNRMNTILSRSKNVVGEEKLDEYTDDINELKSTLESNTESLGEIHHKKEHYEYIRTLLKDDGIKATIIRDYIGLINKKINEFLNAMNFYINMRLDENFNESFYAINKEDFTYKNLSTGQKTRINLSIWLALLEVASVKNSVVTNVLFLDEILENLDANGVKDFMSLCREHLESKNIFVITQRFDEFKDQFRSTIRFKLEQGFTEFENEG